MPRKRIRTIDEIFHMKLHSATDRVPSTRTRLVDERVFSGSLLKFRKCSRCREQKYRRMRSHVRSESWNRVPIWISRYQWRALCGIRRRRGDSILCSSYKYTREELNVIIDLFVVFNDERCRVRARRFVAF